MNAMNFLRLPLVASARADAEASGVCTVGSDALSTCSASLMRRRSSRFSLLVYSARAVMVSAAVTARPISSASSGHEYGHARVQAGASPAARSAPRAADTAAYGTGRGTAAHRPMTAA